MQTKNSKSRIVYPGKTVGDPMAAIEGPRPLLSFVLKTLAGDEGGMTERHLSTPSNLQPFLEEEALERLLADRKKTEIAKNGMIEMMRYLAGVWIDSGKTIEGGGAIDNPMYRNVIYVPPPRERSVWRADPGADHQISGVNVFSIPRGLPISNLIHGYLRSQERSLELREDGSQGVREHFFGFVFKDLSEPVKSIEMWQFGVKVAVYWFAKLLNSSFSRHFKRCDSCGTFVQYDRQPRKPIKMGTYCDNANCRLLGSKRRAEESRTNKNAEIMATAAQAWNTWKQSRGERWSWVVREVNRKHPTPKGLRQKRWFSQNFKDIETAVKAMQ